MGLPSLEGGLGGRSAWPAFSRLVNHWLGRPQEAGVPQLPPDVDEWPDQLGFAAVLGGITGAFARLMSIAEQDNWGKRDMLHRSLEPHVSVHGGVARVMRVCDGAAVGAARAAAVMGVYVLAEGLMCATWGSHGVNCVGASTLAGTAFAVHRMASKHAFLRAEETTLLIMGGATFSAARYLQLSARRKEEAKRRAEAEATFAAAAAEAEQWERRRRAEARRHVDAAGALLAELELRRAGAGDGGTEKQQPAQQGQGQGQIRLQHQAQQAQQAQQQRQQPPEQETRQQSTQQAQRQWQVLSLVLARLQQQQEEVLEELRQQGHPWEPWLRAQMEAHRRQHPQNALEESLAGNPKAARDDCGDSQAAVGATAAAQQQQQQQQDGQEEVAALNGGSGGSTGDASSSSSDASSSGGGSDGSRRWWQLLRPRGRAKVEETAPPQL